jgi:hypothetical protein
MSRPLADAGTGSSREGHSVYAETTPRSPVCTTHMPATGWPQPADGRPRDAVCLVVIRDASPGASCTAHFVGSDPWAELVVQLAMHPRRHEVSASPRCHRRSYCAGDSATSKTTRALLGSGRASNDLDPDRRAAPRSGADHPRRGPPANGLTFTASGQAPSGWLWLRGHGPGGSRVATDPGGINATPHAPPTPAGGIYDPFSPHRNSCRHRGYMTIDRWAQPAMLLSRKQVIRQVRSRACKSLTTANALSPLPASRSASSPAVQRYQSITKCVLG